jgi:TRAP transporter TAXI family solute receptor
MANEGVFTMRSPLVFFLMALTLSPLHAANAAEAALGMVTGPESGTYIAIGQDIARVAEAEGEAVQVKSSNGSIDNIRRIAESGENAAIGIVQSDVLGFLRRSKNPRSRQIAERLRMIFPFYSEEVHVLAGGKIKSFEDLAGRRVVIGEQGSGNMLTAVNLLSIQGVRPAQMIQLPPDQGVVAVLSGEADAAIFTAGKPVALFRNLEQMRSEFGGKYKELLDQVHFLPVTGEIVKRDYDTAEITPKDYDFVKEPVPTVAVTAVLVSFDFSSRKNAYYKARCEQIEHIGAAIRTHMKFLRENGHPKWKEVDPYREVALWQRDKCSWSGEQTGRSTGGGSELERDLLGIIRGTRTP